MQDPNQDGPLQEFARPLLTQLDLLRRVCMEGCKQPTQETKRGERCAPVQHSTRGDIEEK
jgi:hypothetical protein